MFTEAGEGRQQAARLLSCSPANRQHNKLRWVESIGKPPLNSSTCVMVGKKAPPSLVPLHSPGRPRSAPPCRSPSEDGRAGRRRSGAGRRRPRRCGKCEHRPARPGSARPFATPPASPAALPSFLPPSLPPSLPFFLPPPAAMRVLPAPPRWLRAAASGS